MIIKFSLFDAVVKRSSARLPCETWHGAVHVKPSTLGHGQGCPHRTTTAFVPRVVFLPEPLASEDYNQYRYTLIRIVTVLSLHNSSH